jgi:plastocyanin
MTRGTLIALIIGILVIGGAIYAYNQNKKTDNTDTTQEQQNTPDTTLQTPDSATQNQQSTPPPSELNAPTSGADLATLKKFTVTGESFSFSPSTIRVKKGDPVEITFKNTEGFHDLVIEGYNVRTKQIAAGKEDMVSFTADKAGSFVYYCSVGNHRAQGMVGTLIVE